MRHKALVLLRLTTPRCINRVLAFVYHVPMPRVIPKSLMRRHGMLQLALGGYWRLPGRLRQASKRKRSCEFCSTPWEKWASTTTV
jgi:hypothetical protein